MRQLYSLAPASMRPVLQIFDQQGEKHPLKSAENVQENFSPEVVMKAAPVAKLARSRDFFTTYLFDELKPKENFLPNLSRKYFCVQNRTLKMRAHIFVVDLVQGPH